MERRRTKDTSDHTLEFREQDPVILKMGFTQWQKLKMGFTLQFRHCHFAITQWQKLKMGLKGYTMMRSSSTIQHLGEWDSLNYSYGNFRMGIWQERSR